MVSGWTASGVLGVFAQPALVNQNGSVSSYFGAGNTRTAAYPSLDGTLCLMMVSSVAILILLLAAISIGRARKLGQANLSLRNEVIMRRGTEALLQNAQRELQGANQRLETRVQARTAELAQANEALRTEIAERRRMEEERRELEAKMLQTQKLESLGVLAGGIAHDFNNMLTAIMGNADLTLLDLPAYSPVRQNLQEILATSHRAADLCRQMLAYSGRGKFIIENIQLSHLVRETAGMLRVSISKRVKLAMNLAAELPLICADATQLRQIIMNLTINASEAIGSRDGVISISTRVMQCDRACLDAIHAQDRLEAGEYVVLEISDNGCGMDQATMDKMFDPFFTTKFTGRGLGLAAVLGIVRGHRGGIRVHSELGHGTTFMVLLPPQEGELAAASLPPLDVLPASPLPCNKGLVLLVDDEDEVRTVAGKILQRLGFEVVMAANGLEAITLLKQERRPIDCVLLDLTMPKMSGVETFQELKRIRPAVRALLASGYNEEELAHRFAEEGLAGFVQKPYSIEGLAQALDRVTCPGSSNAGQQLEAAGIAT